MALHAQTWKLACEVAIGSDTGGSVRAPAAFCGIVGFKPSKWRVPTEGAFPLSYTLDSVGPMARSVRECAAADAVMAGEEFRPIAPAPLAGLRLGIPQGWLMRNLDDTVTRRFYAATAALAKADVRLIEEPATLLDEMVVATSKANFSDVESFAIYRERLASRL